MIILQDATFHLISKKSISVKVLKKFQNNLVAASPYKFKKMLLPNAVFFFSLQNLTLLILLMKKVNKFFLSKNYHNKKMISSLSICISHPNFRTLVILVNA